MTTLEIIGEKIGARYLVRCNGKDIHLQYCLFKCLAIMAAARRAGTVAGLCQNGWIHKDDIDPDDANFGRIVFNIRFDFDIAGEPIDIQADRLGNWRLEIEPENIIFNMDNLKGGDDQWLMGKLKELAVI